MMMMISYCRNTR